jgi:hypothetical protein
LPPNRIETYNWGLRGKMQGSPIQSLASTI